MHTDSAIFDLEEEDYRTVLAPDIEFEGQIEFSDPMVIRGKVSGSIAATSDLFVDESAEVAANIKASRVVIKGKVKGNITAEKLVRVLGSGSLAGDVVTPALVLDAGCFFSGNCTMTRDEP